MTSPAENYRRISQAAAWLLEGQSTQHVVTRLVNAEGVQRRTARRICRAAWDQVYEDVQEVNVDNPAMASKLIHLLESAAAEGLRTGNVGATVAAVRELNGMLGIGRHQQSHGHLRGRRRL